MDFLKSTRLADVKLVRDISSLPLGSLVLAELRDGAAVAMCARTEASNPPKTGLVPLTGPRIGMFIPVGVETHAAFAVGHLVEIHAQNVGLNQRRSDDADELYIVSYPSGEAFSIEVRSNEFGGYSGCLVLDGPDVGMVVDIGRRDRIGKLGVRQIDPYRPSYGQGVLTDPA